MYLQIKRPLLIVTLYQNHKFKKKKKKKNFKRLLIDFYTNYRKINRHCNRFTASALNLIPCYKHKNCGVIGLDTI